MKRRYIALSASALLFTVGCQASGESSVTEEVSSNEMKETTSGYFSDRDLKQDYDDSEAVHVTLNGDFITADGEGVTEKNSVITITKAGVHIFSGTLNDGSIVVDAGDDDKVQIVLNGVTINSSTSACIYAKNVDKVFVTSIEDNTLTHSGTYEETDDNNVDGVIFAKCDLTLNGTGTLTITDDTGHGVVCKDDLVITGGSYALNVAKHGFQAKKLIAVTSATFDITSGKDGFHAENSDDETEGEIYIKDGSFAVKSAGDGFDASASLTIDGGTFSITANGGSEEATMKATDDMGPGRQGTVTEETEDTTSTKGIKSDGTLTVNGGEFTLDCYDDAIHSNSDIVIEDGSYSIKTGDDAIHADDSVTIYNGNFEISYCYEGIEGMTVTIHDGTYDITSKDDGINAASDISTTPGVSDGVSLITVNGGTITIVSDGDSLDSNGDIVINGGTLNLTCSGNGNTAIDTDGSYTNNGGTVTTNDGSENGTDNMGPGGGNGNNMTPPDGMNGKPRNGGPGEGQPA